MHSRGSMLAVLGMTSSRVLVTLILVFLLVIAAGLVTQGSSGAQAFHDDPVAAERGPSVVQELAALGR